jgi:DNA (cytosine-5)-methyltransferase 1
MFQDNLLRELVVDNFAGGGGASTGIELALGVPVDIAVNHDADAIAMHKVNHPYTTHYQEDVFAINPEKVTGGRPVGLAWFSPDCKHFSRAKGGKPVDKKIRGLSWVVIKWAMSRSAPRVIIMENVPEIQTWCPLKEINSQYLPDPERLGETFKAFVAILSNGINKDHPALAEACEFLKIKPESNDFYRLVEGLGYKVAFKELRACDYGAPTIRNRFYLIARNDGQPIVFPKATHGKGLRPYRTAAECIDMNLPCPSIFGRKKDLATNTQRRIARGLNKFVLQAAEPFIMSNNTGNAPHSINEPLPTVTTGNRNFLCAAYLTKYFSGEKQAGASINAPCPTITGIDHNALVSVYLSCRYGDGKDGRGKNVSEPVPTITQTDHNQLVAAHLLHYYGGADHASQVKKPLPTVTVEPRHYIVKTYLQKLGDEQDLKNWNKIRLLLNNYAGYHIADNEILILEINGTQYFISDIGMRMLRARELMLAQGFPMDYIIDIESRIGKKYSEAKQIARMGNAVCPPVATALVMANCADIALRRAITTMAALEIQISRTVYKVR